MPLEFPEEALESIAAEMDQTAKDWTGDGTKRGRVEIAAVWTRKARVIRRAIDAHREATQQQPLTRRGQFAAMVDEVAAGMDLNRAQPAPRPVVKAPTVKPAPALEKHDHKALAAGERS